MKEKDFGSMKEKDFGSMKSSPKGVSSPHVPFITQEGAGTFKTKS